MTMTKHGTAMRDQFIFTTLEYCVPQNHLVRKLEKAIDLNFIYEDVEKLYSDIGRPSIDPVVLFKLLIINYMFGINSMRGTCRECEVNVAYRWYLGYGMEESIPNFSVFSQNYIRKFSDSNVFENIFYKILEKCDEKGFLKLETLFIDGTHQKASANKHKREKIEIELEAKAYEKALLEEINEDRNMTGKPALNTLDREEIIFNEKTGEEETVIKKAEKTVSTTDRDAGMYVKGEHERQFAYVHSAACDENGFVVAVTTNPGNMHDSVAFFGLNEVLKEKYGNRIKGIALDAGYKTAAVCRELFENGITAFLPYKRPMSKEGYFKKYDYVYDETYDQYICPNEKLLWYVSTNKKGYRVYKTEKEDCRKCPFKEKCTKSETKVILRHQWENYVEMAEEIRCTEEWKKSYPQRKETIERCFADCKEKHGLRYTRLRGLRKNQHQSWLIFSCHNLKKLAAWSWKQG